MSVFEFNVVKGLSCAACVSRLEKALAHHDRIKKVHVNFPLRLLVVDSELSRHALIKFISHLDFEVIPKLEYEELAKLEQKQLSLEKLRLISIFIFSLPTIILAMNFSTLPNSILYQLIFTALLIVLPSRFIFISAFKQLRHLSANMNTLVALSSITAWIYSSVLFITKSQGHLYYETIAMLLLFIAIGKFFEERAKIKASEGLRSLINLRPQQANLLQENAKDFEIISAKLLKKDDIVLVKIGEKIPADGVLSKGRSTVDLSFLTGESLPIEVEENAIVYAGSINLSSVIEVRVTNNVLESELERMTALVTKAQSSKTKIQYLTDRISLVFVPFIIGLSLATFAFFWYEQGVLNEAVLRAIAVLVVACPCALGLATPVAILVATTHAVKEGILVRDARALELLSQVNCIVFDKTGTLTEGKLSVQGIFESSQFKEISHRDLIYSNLYMAERRSNHPLAKAICHWIQKNIPLIENLQSIELQEPLGHGIQFQFTELGRVYFCRVGSMHENDLHPDEQSAFNKLHDGFTDYMSKVSFSINGLLFAIFLLEDKMRPQTKLFIDNIKKMRIMPIIATGDDYNICKKIADELGIKEFHARQTPESKMQLIESLKAKEKYVAMVGDGVNDAPALALAHIGIAMGEGTDVAATSAQIILQNSQLEKIIHAIKISKQTLSIIRQNLFWAFSYNIVLIPMAMLGKLNPMWAGGLMGFSSIIVVLNALRLRKS